MPRVPLQPLGGFHHQAGDLQVPYPKTADRPSLSRRYFVTALLAPATACMLWLWWLVTRHRRAAFFTTRFDRALAEYLNAPHAEPSERIVIEVRPRVENEAVVPIRIRTDLTAVRRVGIFVKKNPNPLVASFDLGPSCREFIGELHTLRVLTQF